jgi:hypothetical protein
VQTLNKLFSVKTKRGIRKNNRIKVLKSRETVLLSALSLLLLLQEAQQEIKSTVTVNTTDMTSRSEAKDGTKETEKEHHPFPLHEKHVFCSLLDPSRT